MSTFFGAPKMAPTVIEKPTPEIVDNSAKTQEEERRKKRRSGAASHFLAQNGSIEGVNSSKTTLGA